MKSKLLIVALVGVLTMLFALPVFSQDEESAEQPKARLFFIHEDVVTPSKVADYEKAAKGHATALAEQNMSGLGHVVISTDDLVYSYVYEIPNMAALDENPYEALKEKMGEEAWSAMWDAYDNTYDSHKDFLVRLHPDLSYNPDGVDMTSKNAGNFRRWDFYYVDPDKGEEAREISKRWRALYEAKNIPTGYRLYTGDLGTDIPLYIAVQWAKSPEAFAAQDAKNAQLLGEAGKKLAEETMAITRKFVTKNGWLRPDLSYMPEDELTKK